MMHDTTTTTTQFQDATAVEEMLFDGDWSEEDEDWW